MTTKAPAVKKYLKALYAGIPKVATEAIQVTYSWPSKPPERRWAMFGDVRWNRTEWKTNRSREEDFAVTVTFSVQINGGTAEEAENYVAAMMTDFESALKTDPSLGGLAVSSGFEPRDLKSWPIDGAFEAQFKTEVSAICRP